MTRSAMEAALELLVKAAATGIAFAVEHYDGQAGSLEEIDQWMAGVQLPAVAIFYDGQTPQQEDESGGLTISEVTMRLWLVHDRLRGYRTAQVAPSGLNELLDALEAGLRGKIVGASCGRLRFGGDNPVIETSSSGRVLWEQRWQFTTMKG